MVSKSGSVGHKILRKTADLTVVKKMNFDTLYKQLET